MTDFILPDYTILETMETLGGSFVEALANLYRRADTRNQARIKAAFAEEWETYRELTELRLERARKPR